jgi:Na+/H+ antiporter NhaD/arsenite permease-like protein
MIDRTGIALVGAIVLVLAGAISPDQVRAAVDVPTLVILFGLMVLSAQYAACGFYVWCSRRIARTPAGPGPLLALTVAVAGLLSAVLANDIVVFAMTPLLVTGLLRRSLDPRPFLIALAAAANAGSAATIIGNPQNTLIGQSGGLFMVTQALETTDLPARALALLADRGWPLASPWVLGPLTVLSSNTIGNVPLVVLLLQVLPAPGPGLLTFLALVSTLAGNLLIVGSLANIITVERAREAGISLGFLEHARGGIPITVLSLACAVGWLRLVG